MRPAVLLDSSSDIDLLQATELGVNLLMQTVEFNGQTWLAPEDISNAELYGPLRAGAARPSPLPITVDSYCNTLERMLGRASHVLAIHPNRYTNDVLAVAEQAAKNFPGRVTVYDAESLSALMALLAERAVWGFEQGLSPEQVVRQLDRFRRVSRSVVCLDTTEFIIPDSPLSHMLEGAPPTVKPLIRTPGGEYELVAVAPDGQVALRLMRQRLQRKAHDLRGGDVVFSHRDAEEQIAVLENTARNLGLRVRFTVTFSLMVSALVGPGAYAFGICPPGAMI